MIVVVDIQLCLVLTLGSCYCLVNKIRSQLVSMKSDMYVVLVVVLPMRLWGFGFFFSINRSLS